MGGGKGIRAVGENVKQRARGQRRGEQEGNGAAYRQKSRGGDGKRGRL